MCDLGREHNLGEWCDAAMTQWQNVAYPRKARASKPETPASKRASAAGPPFS